MSEPISEENVVKIINAGTLAPSGDNCQPWQVLFYGGRLYLKNIETRDRSLYNAKNIASFIAFGAMIENMDIAAKSLGYDMSVTLFPDGENAQIVAVLDFSNSKVINDPLLHFINKRCVNRKKYKPKKIGSDTKQMLLNTASDFENAEFYLIEDDDRKRKMAEIISNNDRILFENKNLHTFLFDHLRWSRKEVESSRDGMSIESLELGNVQSKMFKMLSSWNLVRFLNIFGFSRLVPLQSYFLCRGSSALCVLIMKGKEDEIFIIGGRLFQRIWLTAASLGLSIQPMTGVTLLIQRLRMGVNNGLSITHQEILKNLEKRLKEILPVDENKSIIMTFRVGYTDPPTDKSLRLPAEKVLTKDMPQ